MLITKGIPKLSFMNNRIFHILYLETVEPLKKNTVEQFGSLHNQALLLFNIWSIEARYSLNSKLNQFLTKLLYLPNLVAKHIITLFRRFHLEDYDVIPKNQDVQEPTGSPPASNGTTND